MEKSVVAECEKLRASLRLQMATLPEISPLAAIDSVLTAILLREIGEIKTTLKELENKLRRG